MYANLNPNTMGMNVGSFDQLITLAKVGGFGGVDVPGSLLDSPDKAAEAGERVRKAGLQWGLFWLPCDFSSASEAESASSMKMLESMLPAVRAAGCTRCYNHIWPGSNELEYEANFKVHSARFKTLAALLAEYGVTLGIEFIGPKTLRDTFAHPFIHSLGEAAELIGEIGPTAGFIVDLFHLYTSGGGVEDLRRLVPADRIVNVHANDAVEGISRDEQQDMRRELPLATGVIDAPSIFAWLRESGYAGPVIVEPFDPNISRFRGMAAEDVARETGELLNRLITG